jgi:hypothetical protein
MTQANIDDPFSGHYVMTQRLVSLSRPRTRQRSQKQSGVKAMDAEAWIAWRLAGCGLVGTNKRLLRGILAKTTREKDTARRVPTIRSVYYPKTIATDCQLAVLAKTVGGGRGWGDKERYIPLHRALIIKQGDVVLFDETYITYEPISDKALAYAS